MAIPPDKSWQYTDEDGKVLFEIRKYVYQDDSGERKKRFTQHSPNNGHGWVDNIQGVRRVLYQLPEVLKASTVHLVEGEKDADTLRSFGLTATTKPGGALSTWEPEFSEFLKGRDVIIFPDNDKPGRTSAIKIHDAIRAIAKTVLLVTVPPQYKDITEWVEAGADLAEIQGQIDEWRSLWNGALTEPEEERTADAPELFLPTQEQVAVRPNDIARMIMRDHALMKSQSGMLYEYVGTHWAQIDPSLLRAYAMTYDSHLHTKETRRAEAASYVQSAVCRKEAISWRNLRTTEIPFSNGVLDVNNEKIRPHRQEDYLESVIPHNFDPSAMCPVWLNVIDTWFGTVGVGPDRVERDQKILALQEFFGYVLLPHARYKKALFLQGESDTGKSMVLTVLRLMVGEKNTCVLSTDQMADERKRTPIVGRWVNLLSELPAEAMIADGGFKQLVSTGDAISIDPKYSQPFDYRPFCKHVIACNSLPKINDLSAATFNRLLLITFPYVIPKDKQDDGLEDKLVHEVPGIIAWSVSGARRLIRQGGKFTSIAESSKAVAEYRESQNPMAEFIQEFCVPDEEWNKDRDPSAWDGMTVRFTTLYDRFSNWGARKTLSRNIISRMIASCGYTVRNAWDHDSQSTAKTVFGLGWNAKADSLDRRAR